ncbi:hypothetical protein RN001_009322 [Aquatica leii]|uniref:Protein arginine N-methyltransferase n=1 Tax=Aquatica leii TaxID=1421715 RepID=A0AAN7P8J6_9COLE|nr:hypothetical protein RN001_009322 [Aquatica leii]
MSVFTQKLNPILGENTWETQDEHYDFHQEIARSSFADMLHDTERNRKYYDAIKLAINKMHASGKPAKVLDIGTGTGILSMMAAKCGADSVVACESFNPISECAQKIIRLNNYSDKIKVVNKKSVELTVGDHGDLPERANILVSEVFDTELIGEGALVTFNHATTELLENDPIVIPSSANVYAQVVETPWAQNWNGFKDIYNSDGELLIKAPDCIIECLGSTIVHDIQLSQLSQNSFKEIIPPQMIAQFHWGKKGSFCVDDDCNVLTVTAACNGKAQVVFMWWELMMDTENEIVLSCAPYWAHPLKKSNPSLTSFDIPWRDHWMQAIYYLPRYVNVEKGQELLLATCRDQYSWWFYLHADSFLPKNNYQRPFCTCGLHIAHSRTKIGLINDNKRNKKYLSILEKHVNENSTVLITSDGFYLGLTAAKLGAKKIFYLKDDYFSISLLESFIKFNNIDNVEIISDIDKLKNHGSVREINLILAQPHFFTSILPWDGLYFAYSIKKIQNLLSDNCVIAPKSFTIKGIVVEFNDLQKIRLPLGNVEGFEMTHFDSLIMDSSSKCDDKVEAQPLWEYPCVARSYVKDFIKMDLKDLFEKDYIETSVEFQLDEKMKYNGVALWIDWDLDGNDKNVISTGPTASPKRGEHVQWDLHTRQGVHFLDFESKSTLRVDFVFDVKDGKIKFLFVK